MKGEDFIIEPSGLGEAQITTIVIKKLGKTAFRLIVLLHQFTVSVKAQVGNTKS